MANTITTNTTANTALRYLTINNMNAGSSVAKLSSGSRIVKASDDAASLAVGTKLKADVTALKQAAINASHATSVLQVADGGMARIADILQRMKALAVQASSGSLSDNERAYLDKEYQQLLTQVNDIAGQTKFNGQALIDGSLGTTLTLNASWGTGAGARGVTVRVVGDVGASSTTFQLSFTQDNTNGIGTFKLTETTGSKRTFSISIDTAKSGTHVIDDTLTFTEAGIAIDLDNFVAIADGKAQDLTAGAGTEFDVDQTGQLTFQVGVSSSDKIDVSLADLDATALGIGGTSVSTESNASSASSALDSAISTVNEARAQVGAYMSRFEFVSANLATSVENMDAARSTLMDVDVAAEMTKFTSAQVLMQANIAMLAQANQLPQSLLRLMQ